jgi:F-type H+-transporting ATPase subunit b
MPQIDQLSENWYLASQLFWLVLVFGAIFFGIGLYMLPKVEGTVEQRDRKIADDLTAAKAARDAADAAEEDYRVRGNAARAEAQTLITAAKDKAADAAAKQLAKANTAIEAKLAAAEAEIGAARSSAMAEIEAVAADAATALVARVSGVAVSAADATRAAKAALNHG